MSCDKFKNIIIENAEKKSSERENIGKMKKITKLEIQLYKRENPTEEEEFNLYQLGQKEIAEIHREANRPKKNVKENENLEDSIKICPCCNSSIGEPFNTCDDPKSFSVYGIGVSLYYSSIKFIIFIMLFVSICIGSLNIYYSYKYTSELTTVCNIYYKT